MMTKRDWWIGVLLIALALFVHALMPRYEYRNFGEPNEGVFTRIYRWTGSAELVSVAVSDVGRDRAGRVGARLLNPINESFRESFNHATSTRASSGQFVLPGPSPAINTRELQAVANHRGVSVDAAEAEAEAAGFTLR